MGEGCNGLVVDERMMRMLVGRLYGSETVYGVGINFSLLLLTSGCAICLSYLVTVKKNTLVGSGILW